MIVRTIVGIKKLDIIESDRKNWLVLSQTSKRMKLLIKNDMSFNNSVAFWERVESLALQLFDRKLYRNNIQLCLDGRQQCDYLQILKSNGSERIYAIEITIVITTLFTLISIVV